MNFARKAIAIVISIALIPIIAVIVNDVRLKKYPTSIEFEIVDIDTNTVNVTDQYISNGMLSLNQYNSFTSLVLDSVDTLTTNQHIVIQDYQLVKDNTLPNNLPNDHLYFKVYENEIFEINNDPYQITTFTKEYLSPLTTVTNLTGMLWVGNEDIEINNSINYNINYSWFKSSITAYSSETTFQLTNSPKRIGPPSNYMYQNDSWIKPYANRMFIDSGTDVTNTGLITWLLDNGNLYYIPNNMKNYYWELGAYDGISISSSNMPFISNGIEYKGISSQSNTIYYQIYEGTTLVSLTTVNNGGIWVDDIYKTIYFYDDYTYTTSFKSLILAGDFYTKIPTYSQPTLVYDVTPLINAKVYSPLFETTFDLMDDTQISAQMIEWYEQDIDFNQISNLEDGVQMIINKDGTINFININRDTTNVQINYDNYIPNTSVWASLLIFIPLIFIAGIILYTFKTKD